MTTPLLQTKLYLPPAGPNLVSRPRLIERLDEGIHSTKLTLISAPAGYGKTMLLSEWFAAGDRPVAWLSLDKGDNDLFSFLTYLVAALQTINAGIGDEVLSVLQSICLPSRAPLPSERSFGEPLPNKWACRRRLSFPESFWVSRLCC